MYSNSLIDYLVYFHGPRDYFECHEILEDHWKKDPVSDRKKYWVGLIQIAVSLYHYRIGNRSGAKKLLANAIKTLEKERVHIQKLGLDEEKLSQLLNEYETDLLNGASFKDIDLPIRDEKLKRICEEKCKLLGYKWGQPSNFINKNITYKHTLRDRTEVLEERERQKVSRKMKRGEI